MVPLATLPSKTRLNVLFYERQNQELCFELTKCDKVNI